MVIFLALVALCLFGTTLAGESSDSGCPAVTGQANFDFNRYMGLWHAYEVYVTKLEHEEYLKCQSAEYIRDENDSIHLMSHFVNPHDDTKRTTDSAVTIPDPHNPFKIQVIHPSYPDVKTYLQVLATDYNSYAVVYSCNEDDEDLTELMWIATREKFPPKEAIEKAVAALEKNGLSRSKLLPVDQSNC